jgi:hypothetical protein
MQDDGLEEEGELLCLSLQDVLAEAVILQQFL